MFNEQARRLVRKAWKSLDEFAYELFLLLVSPSDITHTGTITIVNPGDGDPLTLTSSSGSVTLSSNLAVPIIGIVTAVGASNTYTVDLYEDGPTASATDTGVTVTRLVPPAGSFSVGDYILVLRFPNGLSGGVPAYLYYSLSRIA